MYRVTANSKRAILPTELILLVIFLKGVSEQTQTEPSLGG